MSVRSRNERGVLSLERSSFFIACFPSVFRTGAWVALACGVRVSGVSLFFVRLFKLRCGRFYGVWRPVSRTFSPCFSEPGRAAAFAGGVRVSFYRRGAADGASRSATGGWSFRRAMCDEKSVRNFSARFFLEALGISGISEISEASETEEAGPWGRFLNPAFGRVGPAGILSLRHRRPHRAFRRTRLCRARKSTGRF